jgi:hypothetical protein
MLWLNRNGIHHRDGILHERRAVSVLAAFRLHNEDDHLVTIDVARAQASAPSSPPDRQAARGEQLPKK